MTIDSKSVGDPGRFLELATLEFKLGALAPSPTDNGRVARMFRRNEGGLREELDSSHLTPQEGIPGDSWGRAEHRKPEAQITAVQSNVAILIGNGQPFGLFGDGLFLDLNLSAKNLPVGSRLRLGEAVVEVTPKPHNGCKKYLARFGAGALQFVSKPELRHLNLRGIYLRVIEAGAVRKGDGATVLSRGS